MAKEDCGLAEEHEHCVWDYFGYLATARNTSESSIRSVQAFATLMHRFTDDTNFTFMSIKTWESKRSYHLSFSPSLSLSLSLSLSQDIYIYIYMCVCVCVCVCVYINLLVSLRRSKSLIFHILCILILLLFSLYASFQSSSGYIHFYKWNQGHTQLQVCFYVLHTL